MAGVCLPVAFHVGEVALVEVTDRTDERHLPPVGRVRAQDRPSAVRGRPDAVLDLDAADEAGRLDGGERWRRGGGRGRGPGRLYGQGGVG